MRFAYKQLPADWAPGGVIHRPIVELGISGPSGTCERWPAMADTGLDVTLLTIHLAAALGVELSMPETIFGLNERPLTIRFGNVDLSLRGDTEEYHWSTRVAFHTGADCRCYLGHQGFFDLFHVSFDKYHRRLTIRPHPHVAVSVALLSPRGSKKGRAR